MDGELVALFANRGGRELTVLKRRPGGWTQLGEPISTGGPSIASLGQGVSTASEQIDVLVEHGNPVKRTVWSLDGADWIAGPPLQGLGDGPQVGGAVRTGGSVLIPVVDAVRRVWPFSVYDYSGPGWAEVGGTPLNVGRGSAQGRLDSARGTVWAIWQEHRWRGGLFRTRIFTASFNGDEFRRPLELWHGKSIGPGSLEVAATNSGTFALFMRSGRDRQRGLHAHVRRIPRRFG